MFQLAQGIFTCTEAGPEDGGLCVMQGSHLLHQQFYAENGGVDHGRIVSLNSYHFREHEAAWYRSKGCKEVKVSLTSAAGSWVRTGFSRAVEADAGVELAKDAERG